MENEKKNNNVSYNKVNKNKEVIAKEIPEEVKAKNEAAPNPTPSEPPKPKKVLGTVKAPLNLRVDAKKDAKILAVMSEGTVVTIDGEQNGFYKVKFNDIEGYAMSQFIAKR